MKIGDKVEFIDATGSTTGVVGVITEFSDTYGKRAHVLCASGHEWVLRVESLRVCVMPYSPEDIRETR